MIGARLARVAGVVALGSLAGAPGCGEKLCDPELSTSGSYTIHLIDAYTAGGPFQYSIALGDSDPESSGSCQGIDGLQPNASFTLRGNGEASERHDLCEYVTAAFGTTPNALTIVRPTTNMQAIHQAMGTDDLYAIADVKVGTCSGTIVVELFSTAATGGIFSTPVDGALPPAVVYRLFLPSTGPCQACDDNFAASVTRS